MLHIATGGPMKPETEALTTNLALASVLLGTLILGLYWLSQRAELLTNCLYCGVA